MARDNRERLQARTVPERVLATSASTLPVLTPAMLMSTGAGGRNSHQAPRAANPVTARRAFFTVMSFDIDCLTLVRLPLTKKPAQRAFSETRDRKSTRLNSSHVKISYAVFCLKKK